MLYREIVAVYCDIHKEAGSPLCRQKVRVFRLYHLVGEWSQGRAEWNTRAGTHKAEGRGRYT